MDLNFCAEAALPDETARQIRAMPIISPYSLGTSYKMRGYSLQERKLIGYRRGTVTILDQTGLEAAVCGCYETVKDIYTHAQA